MIRKISPPAPPVHTARSTRRPHPAALFRNKRAGAGSQSIRPARKEPDMIRTIFNTIAEAAGFVLFVGLSLYFIGAWIEVLS